MNGAWPPRYPTEAAVDADQETHPYRRPPTRDCVSDLLETEAVVRKHMPVVSLRQVESRRQEHHEDGLGRDSQRSAWTTAGGPWRVGSESVDSVWQQLVRPGDGARGDSGRGVDSDRPGNN